MCRLTVNHEGFTAMHPSWCMEGFIIMFNLPSGEIMENEISTKCSVQSSESKNKEQRTPNSELNYVELPVTGGYVTKVDPETAEKIGNKKLMRSCIDKFRRYPPHVTIYDKKKIVFARYIMNPPSNMVVDHINGDPLDNRKCNLRICTQSENLMNHTRSPRSFSGFWGVSYSKRDRFFQSRFNFKKKCYISGFYRNDIIAAIFRDSYILNICKNNFGLNFPNFLNEESVYDFLESTKGKLFVCWFVKRTNGSVRKILCRSGVTKHLKNTGMCYDSREKKLFVVYDFTKKNYRAIPVENVLCVRFKNKNYRVIRERQSFAA